MQKQLLLGDEAIAEGALASGISGVYAYPGTPSTEITEYIQHTELAKNGIVRSNWSANEKTAYEAALGMSYAGKRALVCMKHVGLNVAADAFMNSAVTGVNGGLVIVSADDPSMHSSQNEQDSRYYGRFAMIPVLEPATHQEAYEATRYAFELSEEKSLPVMLRITTRLAHSRSGVILDKIQSPTNKGYMKDSSSFILLPANARKQYKKLLQIQDTLEQISGKSFLNTFHEGNDKTIGIVACGIAYNYLMETFRQYNISHPVYKIGQYPFPQKEVISQLKDCKEVFFLEEGYPIYEELLKHSFGKNVTVRGRLDGSVPRDGELNPEIVAAVFGKKENKNFEIPTVVVNRPPSLCQGCSHRDLYDALNIAMKDLQEKHVFSDIGCYTLGALPPFRSINTCVDMGASITMAKGAADAGLFPSVAVIGDSTFAHSGMTGLLDAINDESSVTIIISDNSTTGMTGGQKSSGTDKIYNICLGLGVDKNHLRVIVPLPNKLDENIAVIREELIYKGVSVIIAQRECIQTLLRKKKQVKA